MKLSKCDKRSDKPLQELKVKKDAKLEKISEASDEVLAMALRKLMSYKSGKGQKRTLRWTQVRYRTSSGIVSVLSCCR